MPDNSVRTGLPFLRKIKNRRKNPTVRFDLALQPYHALGMT